MLSSPLYNSFKFAAPVQHRTLICQVYRYSKHYSRVSCHRVRACTMPGTSPNRVIVDHNHEKTGEHKQPPFMQRWHLVPCLQSHQKGQFFYCNIFCILFDIKDLIFLCVQSSTGCMCICVDRAFVFCPCGM